jgi:hypothetical protein
MPGAAAGIAEPARLAALRGGACRSERTPQLSPGRASRKREDAGVTRAVDRAYPNRGDMRSVRPSIQHRCRRCVSLCFIREANRIVMPALVAGIHVLPSLM